MSAKADFKNNYVNFRFGQIYEVRGLEGFTGSATRIVVENKTNPEKHETKSFETKEIFTYSDYLVDAMTAHIDRERQKKESK